MKAIVNIVEDIYDVLRGKDSPESTASLDPQHVYDKQIESWKREHPTPEDPIYASEYGDGCLRKLWYKRNKPEVQEPLQPWVKMKFMYGDLTEELVLALAREAGHDVGWEQNGLKLVASDGKELLSGRIDAIIDGHLVDVKSMSTYAFNAIRNAGNVLTEENDKFGYRWQVAFYHHLLVENKYIHKDAQPFILALDKQMGHLMLVRIDSLPTSEQVAKRAAQAMAAVKSDKAPPRGYADEPEGASGNRKLCINCSYCSFKSECWPGLRTFIYSRGPTFLTEVTKEPKVPEVHAA